MPTEARRRERTLEARATIFLVSAMIVLVLLGFARIYTVQQDLEQQQNTSCDLRYAGRADSNEHLRVPLKAALTYLGTIGAQSRNPDPKQRAAARSFGRQFLAYAAAVTVLPNPEC